MLDSLDEYRANVAKIENRAGVRNCRHFSLAMKLLLIGALIAVSAGAQPEKVVFDTDCAHFNDDGAALVMLLHRPQQSD